MPDRRTLGLDDQGSGSPRLRRDAGLRGGRFRSSRLPVALGLALAFAALAAAPVAADTELGHKGTVGWHQLLDTRRDPGGVCRTETSTGEVSTEIRLDKISVRPPQMRSVGDSQEVAWRIVIQRSRLTYESGTGWTPGPWKLVQKGAIQTATATATEDASFERMRVALDVPNRTNRVYRAVVKMFWYHADGTKQGTARHIVDRYRVHTFDFSRVQRSPCQGYEAWVQG